MRSAARVARPNNASFARFPPHRPRNASASRSSSGMNAQRSSVAGAADCAMQRILIRACAAVGLRRQPAGTHDPDTSDPIRPPLPDR